MPFRCPVCAYSDLPEPPVNFSICPCCGTEFGFDDAARSYEELRKCWIQQNSPWFSRARSEPHGWNPWWQLIAAGYGYDVPVWGRLTVGRASIETAPETRIGEPEYRVATAA